MATSAKSIGRGPDHFINRLGLTVVYVGELLRHRAYTRFLGLRNLFLPRIGLGLRNLHAVDLPLVHSPVRRRSHDPHVASVVRTRLRILLRPADFELAGPDGVGPGR
jgi:hypothetical protein